jgi:hypothetical protein
MMKNRAAIAAGLHYLEHESMELKTGDKTWKVYGSPVRLLNSICYGLSDFSQATPRYLPGSFQYEDEAEANGERLINFVSILLVLDWLWLFSEAIYKLVPRDTEILLTHTPAYGVLDLAKSGVHAGCPTLAATLNELKQCKMHVFGHIHEAHGSMVHEGGERVSVNAAMVGGYGQAVIVDLKHWLLDIIILSLHNKHLDAPRFCFCHRRAARANGTHSCPPNLLILSVHSLWR